MASSSSNGGFCYSDAVSSGNNPTVLMNHIHSFVSEPAEDMFNLTSGMENMTGFSKNLLPQQQIHDSVMWQHNNKTLLVDDSSSFRPSQGLSLSLSSSNPSCIELQSFELRHHHHQAPLLQEEGVQHFILKNSKFLLPAQDLLNEFCSLGTKLNDSPKQKHSQRNFNKQLEEENPNKHSLGSLDFVELQKRKTKLLSMLEEVERRYKHYCNQMKAVVSTFEAVAGNGAATVYSALALKAMSRHFRCLKDGIMEQIQGTRKAMGEKDTVAPGTTKGETPRLKLIDQTLRQQRAFQQINMMETHPWRPQRGLPERSVSLLRAWLFEHFLHPYPSDVDKHILAHQTGLSKSQVSNWFINARVRLWKPMVEEMYLEEEKDQKENKSSSEDINQLSPSVLPVPEDDQKPTQARLLRIDSDCVSSIVNNSDHHKHDPKNMNVHEQDTFGSIHELDFSSYTHHSSGMVSYGTSNDHDGNNQSLFHGGRSVSLTLGLPQDGGRGVNLAFQPETQGAMFYQRDHMEESHEYSLLDGEGQNGNIMPYRNLMGTQLLNQY